MCARAGPSGQCPVGAEQHSSSGGSADGAQGAGGEE